MTKKQKAKIIVKEFERLYPKPDIPLESATPFQMLVAVLLSAQCTDKRVNIVTKELFKVAPTPEKMAALKISKLESLIRSCGFYHNKAKHIKSLSKDLIEKFDSKVPDNFKDLESLAGVGHKTASVVMLQSFNQYAFPVDTHIHRLSTRWGLASGKSVEDTEENLKKIFDKSLWSILHLQFIYYGREYCKAHTCKTFQNSCDLCKQFRTF